MRQRVLVCGNFIFFYFFIFFWFFLFFLFLFLFFWAGERVGGGKEFFFIFIFSGDWLVVVLRSECGLIFFLAVGYVFVEGFEKFWV